MQYLHVSRLTRYYLTIHLSRFTITASFISTPLNDRDVFNLTISSVSLDKVVSTSLNDQSLHFDIVHYHRSAGYENSLYNGIESFV